MNLLTNNLILSVSISYFDLYDKFSLQCQSQIYISSDCIWYLTDNKLHRENGPALIKYKTSYKKQIVTERYWNNYRLHRDDGPALIIYEHHSDKKIISKEYYYHWDKLHRVGAPAVIKYGMHNGMYKLLSREWWVNEKYKGCQDLC